MIAIVTLIFVIAFSMLITKVATIALIHTGMTRERARFQARSAFTGAGFTTNESEVVVKHPLRRKIITILLLLGNAGIVTAVSSLILGFVGNQNSSTYILNFSLLFLGISLLYLSTRSVFLDHLLEKLINAFLGRFTEIRPKNFETLMSVMEDFEVTEISTQQTDWLHGSTLSDLNLQDEGILVLGILRNNLYIGVPRGRYEIEEGDRLFVYGKTDSIARICNRQDELTGSREHRASVGQHKEELKEQDEKVEGSED